jgi:hypothetical protein
MTDVLEQQAPVRGRQIWTQLTTAQKAGSVAAIVALVAAAGVAGWMIGRRTAPSDTVASRTACELFPPSLARGLAGRSVERFRLDLDEALPADASDAQKATAEAATAKTCAYVPSGEELGADNGLALQLDRHAYSSRADFLRVHDKDGAEPVLELGNTALMAEGASGGRTLNVLLDDGYSFLLVVADELADEREVVDAGRRIAARFSG